MVKASKVAPLRWGSLALLLLGSAPAVHGCGGRTELGLADDRCEDGVVEACGSDVGICKPGTRLCVERSFGPCEGSIEPGVETCNGLDDDCDGVVDDIFGLGATCDGPDNDVCQDDVLTCDGCSLGMDSREICNGVDDDCDQIVDSDCEIGDCRPALLVTGSAPSSPGCIDFPVGAGSNGVIEYPCGGGPVTATLGTVTFRGEARGDALSLAGTLVISAEQSPDDCVWQTEHRIEGTLTTGKLTYSYTEFPISGFSCWQPCSETGTVKVDWTTGK